jgi:hypothetical protein
VVVHLDGRKDPIEGPATTEKEAAERDLRVITEAQRRGSDAIVALQWLSVKERLIDAAFIRTSRSGTMSAATGGRRHRTSQPGYWREDP